MNDIITIKIQRNKKNTNKIMAAATSVVVLDRGNNTTCTVNLHGKL